jgi:hypothetical protein
MPSDHMSEADRPPAGSALRPLRWWRIGTAAEQPPAEAAADPVLAELVPDVLSRRVELPLCATCRSTLDAPRVDADLGRARRWCRVCLTWRSAGTRLHLEPMC